MKSAVVAVVGRPSAGKSTLLNRACGGKVSIVSPVPQTTRNRVRGIANRPGGQIVFIDTPGWHLSDRKLNLRLINLVTSAVADADLVLYVVDGSRKPGIEEANILARLRLTAKPVVVALNKADARGQNWAETTALISSEMPGVPIHEVSALEGTGVEGLVGRLIELAPEGDQLYPEDFYTDQEPEFRIAEIVREKAIAHTRAELPHALYVRLEDLEMRGGDQAARGGDRRAEASEVPSLWARGFILVERESQKGIVVGKGGQVIRAIVQEAEAELAEIFPYPVKLDMRVKVDRDWRRNDRTLGRIIR